jgi:hypothetical protein
VRGDCDARVRLTTGVQPARRKRAIEANKMRGTKGTKLLEARVKAEQLQKVKGFIPSEVAAKLEAEDAKVCGIVLSLLNTS